MYVCICWSIYRPSIYRLFCRPRIKRQSVLSIARRRGGGGAAWRRKCGRNGACLSDCVTRETPLFLVAVGHDGGRVGSRNIEGSAAVVFGVATNVAVDDPLVVSRLYSRGETTGGRWEARGKESERRGICRGVSGAASASRHSRYAIYQHRRRRRRSFEGLFENGAGNKGRGPRPVRRRLVIPRTTRRTSPVAIGERVAVARGREKERESCLYVLRYGGAAGVARLSLFERPLRLRTSRKESRCRRTKPCSLPPPGPPPAADRPCHCSPRAPRFLALVRRTYTAEAALSRVAGIRIE